MKNILFILYCILSFSCCKSFATDVTTVAVIADCQFADKEPAEARLYRSCLSKLDSAVQQINNSEAVAAFHLGDFIDEGFSNLQSLNSVTKQSSVPFYHVLGNHDFSVEDKYKRDVPKALGLPSRYYDFVIGEWRFVVVDGNDISHYGWPRGSKQHALSQKLISEKYSDLPHWNGGLGEKQLEWLVAVLTEADHNKEKVIILSHFPIFPFDRHLLWNHKQVMEVITKFPNVKAWFNGHNHEGDYAYKNGVHFITFSAMLDTERTAFSFVTLSDSFIEIIGVGKQRSMKLAL